MRLLSLLTCSTTLPLGFFLTFLFHPPTHFTSYSGLLCFARSEGMELCAFAVSYACGCGGGGAGVLGLKSVSHMSKLREDPIVLGRESEHPDKNFIFLGENCCKPALTYSLPSTLLTLSSASKPLLDLVCHRSGGANSSASSPHHSPTPIASTAGSALLCRSGGFQIANNLIQT